MLLAVVGPLLLPLPVCQSGTGVRLLPLRVCQPGTGLRLLPLRVCQPGTDLRLLLAVAGPLLLPLPVCQPGTGLRLLLAVAGPLLLPLPVCQPSTGLDVLLAVAVALLLLVKLMHFDLMCLHTNLHLHRILYKSHNNFKCYKFILHDKFLILRKSLVVGNIYRFRLSFGFSFDYFLRSRRNKMKH
jgi:hypothetical protein